MSPDHPPTTAELLAALHAPLGQALEAVQFALMDRRPDRARQRLDALAAALFAHMDAEEGALLPAYERAVPTPARGAAVGVFHAEHLKIRQLMAELGARLAEGGDGEVSHPRALALLEALHPLKGLLHHHEIREERLLAPALDEALSPEERASLWARLRSTGEEAALAWQQGGEQ